MKNYIELRHCTIALLHYFIIACNLTKGDAQGSAMLLGEVFDMNEITTLIL